MAPGFGESIVKENQSSAWIRIHSEGPYGLKALELTHLLEIPSSIQESERFVVVSGIEALLCDCEPTNHVY